MAGHPGQRRLYDSIRREFYWPHMDNNDYTTVSNCTAGAQNWVETKLRRRLQLFPASSPVASVAINILRQLPSTADGNQYVTVLTDMYSSSQEGHQRLKCPQLT